MENKNTISLSPFAQSVYDVVKLIPKGKISTYKLVAEAINNPKSSQAVGTALSKNPFSPEVSCHRVINSDYSIGGFFGKKDTSSDDVKKKLKILKEEGILFDQNNIKDDSEYRKNITHKF